MTLHQIKLRLQLLRLQISNWIGITHNLVMYEIPNIIRVYRTGGVILVLRDSRLTFEDKNALLARIEQEYNQMIQATRGIESDENSEQVR